MKFNKKVTFEIIPNYPLDPDDEPGCAIGKITIGDFYEHFYMSPQRWAINDYIKQWDLAWQHFENNDTTCFITNYQWNYLLEMWILYKEDKNIYIQNILLVDEIYERIVKDIKVTPYNSFDFILPRETYSEEDEPISEWKAKIIP